MAPCRLVVVLAVTAVNAAKLRASSGLPCYGSQLDEGKMCSSVKNLRKCPNSYVKLDSEAYVQCEVVDGQCLTTGGSKQKLCAVPSCSTSLAVDHGSNIALGKSAKVSSECYKKNPTNKGYLTDGDNRRKGHGDRNYRHSCRDNYPNAEVSFSKKCIREVKIWSRCDCCSDQMKGVVAEVWTGSKWERCGGTSTDVGVRNYFTFACAIEGTKARIVKKHNNAWITTSEMEVFGAMYPRPPPKTCDMTMGVGQVNIIGGLKPRVDSNCFTPLRDVHFLTDGNKMKGLHQNKNYWHSCAHGNHWVEVDFPETCVRELKIWSRPDVGHKHTQMTGVTAEVWSDGQWKRCGGVSPSTHGHAASFAFNCALVGTKARLKQSQTWLSISEFMIFGPSDRPLCTKSLSKGANLAVGKRAKVSSECYKKNPTNKDYLTDGDNRRNGHGDRNYWHSCRDNRPNAEVQFKEQCVRGVKIWSRADCCSHQMKGVAAEVWTGAKWERCGGTSTDVGRKNSFSFDCAIVGSKARIIKYANNAWITTSEMEVFGAK